MAVIAFLKGANQGSTMELQGDKIVLGRNADCGVILNVPAVSREHAVIRRIQDKFYIEDMKSRNGTYVNNKEVSTRTLLKDNDRIKICDNLLAFYDAIPRAPLPPEMTPAGAEEEEDDDSSTVEATISGSSKQILEAQPAEKLAMLLEIGTELSRTFDPEELFAKIVDSMFQVFRQADRTFIILEEEGKLLPKVIRTRRAGEEEASRFSRRIVNRCLENAQSILSEDANQDFGDLSQSIADCRIRSIMLAPLMSREETRPFGVIQLDTQDRFKKFTADDLKLLLAVAGQAAVALENARLHTSLVARAGLERDLERAHQVQLSFLPKKLPQFPGYEFFAFYESAQEVGGDYYDFIPFPGGERLGVMLGDVAGKGMPAALLMAKVSSDARFCTLTEKSLGEAVSRLNDLMQEAGLLDRFVTLGACLIDQPSHQLTIANAGHNPLLIYRQATGVVEEAHSRDLTGLPLGVMEGIAYDSATLTLDPGDFIVLFSDGVPDAKNKFDKEFGNAGVLNALKAGPMNVKDAGERLVAAVKQHFAGCKQHDDITLVCFGRV